MNDIDVLIHVLNAFTSRRVELLLELKECDRKIEKLTKEVHEEMIKEKNEKVDELLDKLMEE